MLFEKLDIHDIEHQHKQGLVDGENDPISKEVANVIGGAAHASKVEQVPQFKLSIFDWSEHEYSARDQKPKIVQDRKRYT